MCVNKSLLSDYSAKHSCMHVGSESIFEQGMADHFCPTTDKVCVLARHDTFPGGVLLYILIYWDNRNKG